MLKFRKSPNVWTATIAPGFGLSIDTPCFKFQCIWSPIYSEFDDDFAQYGLYYIYPMVKIYDPSSDLLPQGVIAKNKSVNFDKNNNLLLNTDGYRFTISWDGTKFVSKAIKIESNAKSNIVLIYLDGMGDEYYDATKPKKTINAKVGQIIEFKEVKGAYGYVLLVSGSAKFEFIDRWHVKVSSAGSLEVWGKNNGRHFLFDVK